MSGNFSALLQKHILHTLLLALLCSNAFGQSQSQWAMSKAPIKIDPSKKLQSVQMVVNSSREIVSDQPFRRVTIANPAVLNPIPLEGWARLQINALATGMTTVDLVAADNSEYSIEVMVLGDVRELEAVIRQQYPDGNIRIMPVQQGCILGGNVSAAKHVAEIASIAELYFPKENVINKIEVSGVHTVQLQVQIMEVSRTKLRELGIDWALTAGNTTIGQGVGGLLDSATRAATGQQNVTFSLVETDATIFASINALRRNNLVKVLATPTLTAVDGRPASFNVGGEIPILVPQGLGNTAVQFREYGTRLDYVAKVKGNGKIWLDVRPYVSEIDPTRSVELSGVNVPGLRSRFLETGVELGAGQTLALGGLLQVRTEALLSGVPFFSEMPYIGTFFRSTREEQNEIELLITVTPNFAGPMDACDVPRTAPGINSQSPTDKDLYIRGYIETPVNTPPTTHEGYGLLTEPVGATVPGGYPTAVQPMPSSAPNPAAMSVGPNAPKLAQPTGYYTGQKGGVVR
ncbi:MAG: pilus assembly protein N-terminal domain-containing protein [Planctomycetota bacterium]